MTIDDFLIWLEERCPDLLYPTDLKEAIIGYVERCDIGLIILLDSTKCLDILVDGGMTYEEAVEYFDVNVIGSYVGEGTPCFATLINNIN